MEKSIPGFDDYYARDDGQIISKKRGNVLIKKQRLNRYGYFYVNTCAAMIQPGVQNKKKVCVHVLMLLAYQGVKPFPKAQGRHLDGNRKNNLPDNLLWGTQKENSLDMVRHGTTTLPPTPPGENHPAAKLRDDVIIEMVDRYRKSPHNATAIALAAEYGIHPRYVQSLSYGRGRGGQLCQQ